tara:strand:+ start:254 stop:703 length:450 start_codon:yes stop_codon:yes gene_type:complete
MELGRFAVQRAVQHCAVSVRETSQWQLRAGAVGDCNAKGTTCKDNEIDVQLITADIEKYCEELRGRIITCVAHICKAVLPPSQRVNAGGPQRAHLVQVVVTHMGAGVVGDVVLAKCREGTQKIDLAASIARIGSMQEIHPCIEERKLES